VGNCIKLVTASENCPSSANYHWHPPSPPILHLTSLDDDQLARGGGRRPGRDNSQPSSLQPHATADEATVTVGSGHFPSAPLWRCCGPRCRCSSYTMEPLILIKPSILSAALPSPTLATPLRRGPGGVRGDVGWNYGKDGRERGNFNSLFSSTYRRGLCLPCLHLRCPRSLPCLLSHICWL
jgi:hypothetical protein